MTTKASRVLVTGAGGAIGGAVAARLAASGAHVIGTDRMASSSGQNFSAWITADIATTAGRARIVEAVGASLDGLVHAAGIVSTIQPGNVDEEEWDRVFAVNVKAPFFLSVALADRLADGASVVVIGSIASKDTQAKSQRWLDMSWLNGSKLSFRIVELSSADAPVAVTSYGTFPGEDRKYFCSFCGASGAEGTPLMIGPAGNICPRCVRGYASWATEQSGDS